MYVACSSKDVCVEQFAYLKLHVLFSQWTLARRMLLHESSPPCQESCHAETFGSRLGTRLQRKSRLLRATEAKEMVL